MGRRYSGHPTCENCPSIDVRRWHREGRLRDGQWFPYGWNFNGEPAGGISVRVEADTVVLSFRFKISDSPEWKSVAQRVSVTWTPCHLGGWRAWFCCDARANGQYCMRRVAKLYRTTAGIFACRHCHGLNYAS